LLSGFFSLAALVSLLLPECAWCRDAKVWATAAVHRQISRACYQMAVSLMRRQKTGVGHYSRVKWVTGGVIWSQPNRQDVDLVSGAANHCQTVKLPNRWFGERPRQ